MGNLGCLNLVAALLPIVLSVCASGFRYEWLRIGMRLCNAYRWCPGASIVHRWQHVGNTSSDELVLMASYFASTLTILHIGPSELYEHEISVYQMVSQIKPSAHRFILVDPNEYALNETVQHFQNASIDMTNVKVVNAAICDEEKSDMAFYGFFDELFKHFPDALRHKFYLSHLGSLSKDSILGLFDPEGNWQENFTSWSTAVLGKSISLEEFQNNHIEEKRVQCHTPTSLLRATGTDPADVQVLVVDAEGYDLEILGHFLRIADFSPNLIQFEWGFHVSADAAASGNSEHAELISRLAEHGYDAYRAGHDILAFKVESRLRELGTFLVWISDIMDAVLYIWPSAAALSLLRLSR
eukprot:gnl/TRDRNA2_/TRDRNA2_93221_c0_seq1.p1 gnl/TRDRNA2_/TRDRNA2_93221_c0~~gnl/TRDRNA2_/TRDRNA2_93221_c0_seq1.p1  ORF type:complete len:355 (+),score=43.53 gnl/TRDRNA2_/TRDRNA2_93221_c0_seq1:57-1121(+)